MTTGGTALSRRGFMALAGGSVAAASFLAACGGGDSATAAKMSEFGEGDVGILNYALTLEHLEASFYTVLGEGNLLSPSSRATLERFGVEEEEHVAKLTEEVKRLGGHPAPKREANFSLDDETGALELAGTLENLGAAAYLGQLPRIKSDTVLGTVLSIHSVEGRHAGAVNELLEEAATPDGAFAKPATPETVLAAVAPYMDG
jgi:rubrerythrin